MMKKTLIAALLLIAGVTQAQIGIKGGANFSNIDGKIGGTEFETKISYHIGAFWEIPILDGLAFQPEILYSVQGANIDSSHTLDNIDLKYLNVPMMLKLYIMSHKLSIEAGPQFGYLTDHNLDKVIETEDFDFSLAGGISVYVTKSIFIQGRYIAGMNEFSKDAEVKNRNIQLSLGIKF